MDRGWGCEQAARAQELVCRASPRHVFVSPSRGGEAAQAESTRLGDAVVFLFGRVVLAIPGTEPSRGCPALHVNRLTLGDPLQCALSLG